MACAIPGLKLYGLLPMGPVISLH
ncbi:unnamed protein product [Acanthoscelides obtectus]|uniref:Uncharacterized protein n=1 Tax=Acanthoscelides obtectus TaxID=200917 RepID=A0A9P0KY66_ACAOB|nr:unnamed protein product [Acanthoscelides obtectus]CAK1645311.1 hypothetical protein AOBTE_LOCUS14078 [Acanthoscelides obtectus]